MTAPHKINTAPIRQAHEAAARFDLNVCLSVIHCEAIQAMKHADGRWPEVHQHLATIASLVDDAQHSLAQADTPIDARQHLDYLDEGTSDMDVDR